MDEWGDLLFEASYGGLLLDIISTDDDVSRALAIHKFPFRDGAVLQDVGAEPRQTTVSIIFLPIPTQDDNHINRLTTFLTLVNEGVPQSFVHPLTGDDELYFVVEFLWG